MGGYSKPRSSRVNSPCSIPLRKAEGISSDWSSQAPKAKNDSDSRRSYLGGSTDPRGIENRTTFDKLGRTTKTIENYVDGTVSDADDKTTEYTYSAAGMTSLTAKLTGGGGQTTEWVYGVTTTDSGLTSNDIVGVTKWPDPSTGASSSGQQETVTVDALGETKTSQDRNGNVHTIGYDVLGRMVTDTVTTLGSGVDGSVRRLETAYDTQGNPYLLTSYDSTSGGSIVNQVQRTYNGLGQLTIEYQSHSGAVNTSTSPKVQYSYSTLDSNNRSRLTGVTYPNGRAISYNYTSGLGSNISRLSSIADGSTTLESYQYLGAATVVVRAHPEPGIDLSYVKLSGESVGDAGDQYTGLDRFDRIKDQRWRSGTTDKDRNTYTYDRDGNRLTETNTLNSAFNETYTYDNLNQLASFNRNSGARTQSWDYDALGNWDSVTTDSTTQTRSANKQNEVTSVSGATTPTYDANGNMTKDETGKQYTFDAWNRLKVVKDSGGTTLVTYGYDARNYRIVELGSSTRDLYYNSNWQLLEERVGGTAQQSFVWSPVYVDAMIARDRDTDANGSLDERLYPTHDANFNVTSLFSAAGVLNEKYAYDPFGEVTIYNAGGTTISTTAYGWSNNHQGGRLSVESALYYFRNRDYSATLGQWVSDDPLGYAAGDLNLRRYVGNNATNGFDPLGLADPTQMPKPYPFPPLIQIILKDRKGIVDPNAFGALWGGSGLYDGMGGRDKPTTPGDISKDYGRLIEHGLYINKSAPEYGGRGMRDDGISQKKPTPIPTGGIDKLEAALLVLAENDVIARGYDPREEARNIARAIKNTWDNNSKPDDEAKKQTVKGYYCYEWAMAFMDAGQRENKGGYFELSVDGASTTKGSFGDGHAWLVIRDKASRRAVYVDDGWGIGGGRLVHSDPPSPKGYIYPGGPKPLASWDIPDRYDANGNKVAAGPVKYK